MKHKTGNAYSHDAPYTKWERARRNKEDARFAFGLAVTLVLVWVAAIIG